MKKEFLSEFPKMPEIFTLWAPFLIAQIFFGHQLLTFSSIQHISPVERGLITRSWETRIHLAKTTMQQPGSLAKQKCRCLVALIKVFYIGPKYVNIHAIFLSDVNQESLSSFALCRLLQKQVMQCLWALKYSQEYFRTYRNEGRIE